MKEQESASSTVNTIQIQQTQAELILREGGTQKLSLLDSNNFSQFDKTIKNILVRSYNWTKFPFNKMIQKFLIAIK